MDPVPQDAAARAGSALLWYAAYGSNMSAARFRCYLSGGTPVGGRRRHPGCRDTRGPRDCVPVHLPGGIYFAEESAAWTGGLALYDPSLPGAVPARAYLITAAQFADVAAQEMYRDHDVASDVVDEVVRLGRLRLGPGRYETLICLGTRDGSPVLTFTSGWDAGDVAVNPPAPAYLAMLAGGLHEAHGWTAGQITGYLTDRPGVHGRWHPDHLAAVVAAALHR